VLALTTTLAAPHARGARSGAASRPGARLEWPWGDFAAAREALLARRIGGKAVLRVDS
jgi:hypothetical protein